MAFESNKIALIKLTYTGYTLVRFASYRPGAFGKLLIKKFEELP